MKALTSTFCLLIYASSGFQVHQSHAATRRVSSLLDSDRPPLADLSYASYFSNPIQKRLVRFVERLSGLHQLQRRYDYYHQNWAGEIPFLESMIRLLDLHVEFSSQQLAQIPTTGSLVVVANHPFGVLDGLVLSWLVSQVRSDFLLLTNAALDAIPEVSNFSLPVDFGGTARARAINVDTRKRALGHLQRGGCILIFPAGGVATTPRWYGRQAIDDTWRPFAAKLIQTGHASVTPVYFEGQNSRLFQWASHCSLVLRLALLFRQVGRRIGTSLTVGIGDTLSPEVLQERGGSRSDLMRFLRRQTYAMAPEFRQRRIRWAEQKWEQKKPRVFR